jgi:hypothetical protein
LLKERGARVFVDCQPSLQRLVAAQPYIDGLVSQDNSSERQTWDFSAPLLSLPHLFGTTLDSIPSDVPYIIAPVTASHPAISAAPGMKVGLVWAGSQTYRGDRKRSIDLSVFEPLGGVEGVSWFSLQTGPAVVQLQHYARPALTDLSMSLTDWAETAQVIQQLDLVITVDTGIAHLAGALGKPCWVLISENADWRWLLSRDDSPWYPAVRLFRQEQADAWEPVVARVATQLSELIRARQV